MSYRLGVDLGTTWTAAAVDRDGVVQIATLGSRGAAMPTVVWVGADGTTLVGDAAVRRALAEPARVAREFKRRVGDPTPVLVGGAPWSAEALMAQVLRWVHDSVAAEQGGPPVVLAVTHPASWGPFKLDLLAQAARQVGLGEVTFVPEPVAAATWYASQHRIGEGEVVAVYDLGGGTFDAAVVQRTGAAFAVRGTPEGIDRFGGIDVDAAVFGAVAAHLGGAVEALDDTDPAVLADVAALRADCTAAKEALSDDAVAMVPVRLPGLRVDVRITRDELEDMVRGPLGQTVVALRRAVASAGIAPAQLASVLLVGGSSRIPLVAQLVGAELGVPVAVDANPKYAVASGAALAPVAATPAVPPTVPPPAAPAVEPWPVPPPPGGSRPRWPLAVGGVVVVALVAIGVALATAGGDDPDDDLAVDETTTTTDAQPTTTIFIASATATTRGRPTTTTPTTAAIPQTTSFELVAVDFGFNGVPPFAPPGEIRFNLRNEGAEDHELLVLGGLEAEDLPEGTADELRAHALAFDDGGELSVAPEGSGRASITLEPGRYFVTCLLPVAAQPESDHRLFGMFAGLTIR